MSSHKNHKSTEERKLNEKIVSKAEQVGAYEKAMDESPERRSRDTLANDEPFVLESSAADPEFPAMQEFEVDEDGPKGSKAKHPGLIWAIIAVVAVAILCMVLASVGDWRAPDQAQQIAQTEENEQIVPEDLGEN